MENLEGVKVAKKTNSKKQLETGSANINLNKLIAEFEGNKNKKSEFEVNLLSSVEKIQVADTFSNSLLGLGKNNNTKQQDKWELDVNANNWPLWLALYQSNWIFKNAIDKTNQDIVKLQLNFNGEGAQDIDKVSLLQKDIKRAKTKLEQLLKWGALFGGSIAVMFFDNIPLNEMVLPLNLEDVKKTKNIKLHVLSRWDGIEPSINDVVLNLNDEDFNTPRYYEVILGKQRVKVHHSFVLRYEHRSAPRVLKNGILGGWGIPEGVHLFNEIARDEKLKESIGSLIDKSLIEVIKMSGMKSIFMSPSKQGEEQIKQRLHLVNQARNFNSITFLDTNDEYLQNQFSGLSGLSDLMQVNIKTIAAALDMSGVLFGDLSGGFSPDNFALVRYDNTVRNKAENYYRPVLNKFIKVLKVKNQIEGELDFEFESMLDAETTNIDKMKKVVDVVGIMLSDGYLSVKQAAKEVKKYAKSLGIGESIEEDKIPEETDEEIQEIKEFEDVLEFSRNKKGQNSP